MTQHTNTPWEIRKSSERSTYAANWREIYAGNVPIICAASFDRHTGIETETICGVYISESNAEFIICACNCHDDLVHALKSLLLEIKADPGASAYFDLRHIKAAEDAIAKAKPFVD